MKCRVVFTINSDKSAQGHSNYSPPPLRPVYYQVTAADDKLVLQDFRRLLAIYKRAGNEVAQQLRQDSPY